MSGRIDYQIEKYSFTAVDETPRLARQWADVMDECRQTQAGAQERLRIALLNVDYVTSLELPFRLLLVRAPQLIDSLRDELQISHKPAVISGSRWGCTYSLKSDLSAIPDAFSSAFPIVFVALIPPTLRLRRTSKSPKRLKPRANV